MAKIFWEPLSLSDSHVKHLQMYLCLCCEWLYFYSHTKSNSVIAQNKEQENSTVIHWKAKHQIPPVLNTGHLCDDGDEGRASQMARFLIPVSLFSDRPAVSMLHYWYSGSQGLHELQRMAQAASRIEASCVQRQEVYPLPLQPLCPPCFSLLFSHKENLNTHTHTPTYGFNQLSPFGVQFLQPPHHHNHLISWLRARHPQSSHSILLLSCYPEQYPLKPASPSSMPHLCCVLPKVSMG